MSAASAKAKTNTDAMIARKRALDSYLNPGKTTGHFRDPALRFGKAKKDEPVDQDIVIGGDNHRG